ncbi:protein of unknown function, partial [uncultured Woeseiaceae bacterium]
MAFPAWLGRFCGALVTYYNLDVKEGALELAISGTFLVVLDRTENRRRRRAPPSHKPGYFRRTRFRAV